MEFGQVNAAALNLDVLVAIFKRLDTKSRGKTAQVCKAWENAMNHKSLWKNYTVKLYPRNCNSFMQQSISARGIKKFMIAVYEPRVFEFLIEVPNLEGIHLNDDCLNVHLLPFLQNPTINLKWLNLSHCSRLTDNFLHNIMFHLPTLIELDISFCRNVTVNGFRMLASDMKELQRLHLNGIMTIFSDFHIREKIAYLTGRHLTDDSARSLQHLHLKENWMTPDIALRRITRRFTNLVTLELNSYHISDAGVSYLIPLQNLKYLNLFYCCKITDIGMRSIIQLSNLSYLNIGQCGNISDAGFQCISGLSKLRSLNLSFCVGITDTTLQYLTELKSLRVLSLEGCRISDMGLDYLSDGDMKLIDLDLSYCERIGYTGFLNISQSSIANSLRILRLHQNLADLVGQLVKKFRRLKKFHVSRK